MSTPQLLIQSTWSHRPIDKCNEQLSRAVTSWQMFERRLVSATFFLKIRFQNVSLCGRTMRRINLLVRPIERLRWAVSITKCSTKTLQRPKAERKINGRVNEMMNSQLRRRGLSYSAERTRRLLWTTINSTLAEKMIVKRDQLGVCVREKLRGFYEADYKLAPDESHCSNCPFIFTL